MSNHGFSAGAAAAAGMLAGPIFLIGVSLAQLYLQLPAPVEMGAANLVALPGLLLLAAPIGAIVGVPACMIGGFVMSRLARILVSARTPITGGIVGGAIGLLVLWLIAPTIFMSAPIDRALVIQPLGFGLVAASAMCGWLTRRWSAGADSPPSLS